MKVNELKKRHDASLRSITKEMRDSNFKQVVIENEYGTIKIEYER